MRGVRGRLTVTIVALVALTAALLGIGAYVFVDYSLHDRFRTDAANQARFDLSVLIPRTLTDVTREALNESGLQETFGRRDVVLVADFGDVTPEFSPLLSEDFGAAVERGEIGYQWATIGGRQDLVVGGRLPGSEAIFYFVHDATTIESALAALRVGLLVGTAGLILVALIASRAVARGVLAPVEEASRAAERIERGDLSARVPVESTDEFGDWAETFNRMAASLEGTIDQLEAAQSHNRRFVSDVSHELRTPLAALVAEASILRDDLDALPEGSRRAGELLVADIARLRILVDDLMEISRFDAGAEQLATEPVDLGQLVDRDRDRPPPRGCPRGAAEPRHRRLGSAPDRPDRRQPPRQRPRARARRAGRGSRPARRDVGERRRRRPRPGCPAGPAGPPVRPLLQGRSVPPRRQQRARPRDRRRACRSCWAASSRRRTARVAGSRPSSDCL